MPVSGFPKQALEFLATLSRNNSVEWFHAHRVTYDEMVREPMVELVKSINLRLATFAPAYAARLPSAISRPNRDTRFSRDKAPYRTDISAVFPREGSAKQEAAGFFFRIAPDGVEVVGGVYVPGQPELDRLRRWIADNHQELTRILAGSALRRTMGPLQGEQLQRVPREYPADHPAAPLLRRKQWFLRRILPPGIATTKRLEQELATRFKLMTPLVSALDQALGNA